jgi:hypothetical protein
MGVFWGKSRQEPGGLGILVAEDRIELSTYGL